MMNGKDLTSHVWLKKSKRNPWLQAKEVDGKPMLLEDAIQFCQDLPLVWEIDMWVEDNPDYPRITIAQARTDTPGTMAALYAAGKMGRGR
jgi:hypothetical protein